MLVTVYSTDVVSDDSLIVDAKILLDIKQVIVLPLLFILHTWPPEALNLVSIGNDT